MVSCGLRAAGLRPAMVSLSAFTRCVSLHNNDNSFVDVGQCIGDVDLGVGWSFIIQPG